MLSKNTFVDKYFIFVSKSRQYDQILWILSSQEDLKYDVVVPKSTASFLLQIASSHIIPPFFFKYDLFCKRYI